MPTITRTEYVEINSVPLATPAWEVTDLSPLWEASPVRGEDRLIPYLQGRQPLQRVIDELRVQVPLVVYGDFDQDGVAIANGRIGLMNNLDYLKNAFMVPNTSSTEGTWPLILHMPDSSTRGADCFVLPPLNYVSVGPITVRCVLDILIPAGELT